MSDQVGELMARGREARREGRFDDSLDAFAAAVAVARQQSSGLLIQALKGRGQAERDRGDLTAACVSYGEATRLARQGNDRLGLAHTVRHLGDIHREAGHPELAGPCLEEALRLYRDDDDTAPLDLANAMRPLALLRTAAGDHAAAAHLWAEAGSLYASLGVTAGVQECSDHLVALDGRTQEIEWPSE